MQGIILVLQLKLQEVAVGGLHAATRAKPDKGVSDIGRLHLYYAHLPRVEALRDELALHVRECCAQS